VIRYTLARLFLLVFLCFALNPVSANDEFSASPEQIAQAKEDLGRSLSATLGKKLAKHLVGRGLAEQDAERIATRTFETYAVCIVDVLVDQAEKQQQPIVPILDSMKDLAVSPELQEIGDRWDKDATRQALLPCAANVASAAGVQVRE